MKPIDIVQKHMGSYKQVGDEIQVTFCPYCGGGSKKDKNTFSVNADTGAHNCLRGSCGVRGSLRDLMKHFEGQTMEVKAPPKVKAQPQRLKATALSEKATAYLEKRGFSPETWQKFGVSETNGALTFPYYENGKLVLIKYRKPEKYTGVGQKAWREKGGKAVLWGMDLCDQNRKGIIICEGEMDQLALAEADVQNVVSVPSGAEDLTWVENCWDWLEQWDEVCIWPDNDEPGLDMCRKLINKLGPERCFVVQTEHKDANAVLYHEGKEGVRDCVYSAKPVPMAGLVRLADVENFNIDETERIRSVIPPVNRIIGGHMTSMLSVWTGINSSGKSTYLGQELIESIEQGYRVAAYSGELPAPLFRYWIELQMAGPKYVDEIYDEIKEGNIYRVNRDMVPVIRQWYKDKFYVYDAIGGVDADSLFKVFSYAAKRYGCKVFLVDNLMLMTYSDNDKDFYRKQSDFVKRLKKFAQDHDVHVHLVAHPRKESGRLEKQSVMGSGDITNVADCVYGFHRMNDEEKAEEVCDNCIDIFKNRMLGTQDVMIRLLFDEKSKRFYSPAEQGRLWQDYGWTKNLEPADGKLVLAGGIQ